MLATGAVITGRRTGDFVGYWGGNHHEGRADLRPDTKRAGGQAPRQRRFVTDGIESCVKQAKVAASGRDVMLHGAYTAQGCLRAHVLDVLEIQLIPVQARQAGRRVVTGPG
jgi:dihydrofolate reductase